MKFLKFFSILVILSAITSKAHAIPLPFGFLLKPYVGAGYINVDDGNDDYRGNFSSLAHLNNINLTGGMRLHRNFGVEVAYFGVKKELPSLAPKEISGITKRALLFAPILKSSLLNTGLEMFVGVGSVEIDSKTANSSISDNALQTSAGLQLTLLGRMSARLSMNYIDADKAISQDKIKSYSLDFIIYFL